MMFKTLRTKLLVGLTPLLFLMVALGLWAVTMFSKLGNNIDVILRENYRSVRAAQGMKEALERMDSSLLFAIGGEEQLANDQFTEFRKSFDDSLKVEQGNITLAGEAEMVAALTKLRGDYYTLAERFFGFEPEQKAERTRLYFTQLLPTFQQIKREADRVLELNQRNMEDESERARAAAAASIRLMILALLGAAVVATAIAVGMSRSILEPIRDVTRAARAMSRGDLDQVVPVVTRDELGELAGAFNVMARTLREFRQSGTERLLRAQKTAQATIDSFPDPVVVVDTAGSVERANPAARRILGVASTNGPVPWSAPATLRLPLDEVLTGHNDYLPTSLEQAVCIRDDGQERYFLPRILAIRDNREGLLGAALVLSDVTKFRLVDQLKSDMVSTVSHELKTPLTSVQMAIHLLLEEMVGPLTPKQVELLLAARQDSDRLLGMVNDLLDLTRIEQGRLQLDLAPVAPRQLVMEAIERFKTKAQDSGIALEADVAPDLPRICADRERIGHVFDNLLANALRHTRRGGIVRIDARRDGNLVRLSIEDNGEGIPPDHQPHLFEKFYRVPGAQNRGGAGLGLAITREIVVSHGGQIDVTSRPGERTVFSFTIPVSNHLSPAPGQGQLAS
jgi:two-component system, NtrC family, sensor histidine kinase KinB